MTPATISQLLEVMSLIPMLLQMCGADI
jgi:hypothetical protein